MLEDYPFFLWFSLTYECIQSLIKLHFLNWAFSCEALVDHMRASTSKILSHTGAWRSVSKSEEKSNCISLHPFGLATYKARGNLWLNPENGDDERIVSLYSAANCWLNQLKVHHNDFNFFNTHWTPPVHDRNHSSFLRTSWPVASHDIAVPEFRLLNERGESLTRLIL